MIDDRWVRDEGWQDSTPVAVAGGVSALALVGLLVYAVVSVSHGAVEPPPAAVPPAPSTAVSSTSAPRTSEPRTLTATTSYPVPSPQTSDGVPPPAPPPPSESEDSQPTESPSTTASDPYATTTTGSAGHV